MQAVLKILILDDDEGDRKHVKRSLLRSWPGCECTEMVSIDKALAACEKSAFDCAIVDYLMPGHDGLVSITALHAQLPYMPIVMITSQGDERTATEAMKRGASDYIPKGQIDAESIKRIVISVMEKAALQRKVTEQQKMLENFARVLVHAVESVKKGTQDDNISETITPETLQRVIDMASEHGTLQKHVLEQSASLEIFTRALAHDLKEPVRTIRSFLDRISDWRLLSEKSQQSFHYISKAADRMNALIDAVYLYTRLDATEQMEKNACDIVGVLEGTKENLAKLRQERGTIITHDALPAVRANQVQIMQLFQNLLSNAIRHSESPVTIHIGVQEHEKQWQFYVHDNGPGIAREYIETIFNPFKRLSHRKEDGPGLGLGLAISRKIVEYHDGKLWCESEPGAGTTFYFTLPKTEPFILEKNTILDNISPLHGLTQSLARILLVDDNEADIELNRILLIEDAHLRCDVLTASDSKEALARLHEAAHDGNPVDLILLDINMPGLNGFELMERMQKEEILSGTMVVMCTTSDYDMDRLKASSFGTSGYLTKPPQFSLLKDIINSSHTLRLNREGEGYALFRAA